MLKSIAIKIGIILVMLGVATADSENLLIPLTLLAIGGATIYFAADVEGGERNE